MSMLGRAARKFEKAFVAQPEHVKQAVALAIYRASPAIAQYQKDLAVLTDDPAIIDAVWDLALASAFRLVKGKDAIGEKQIDELRANAPETADFFIQVGRMISGLMPGMNSQPLLTAMPPRELAALPGKGEEDEA